MDTSSLEKRVTDTIGELHGVFDEIGLPRNEREVKESELFAALSETLHSHLRRANADKTRMTEEAETTITTILQMEASLDDEKQNGGYNIDAGGLCVTYPLNECLRDLREKFKTVSRLHSDRFEQVRKLVQALESYSSHLEAAFIRIKLPPTNSSTCPPNFDLSPRYVTTLDEEFTRVYDEYNKRLQMVQITAEEIIRMYSDLGIPQAQTDSAIVKHYRDSPEQLGLHKADLDRLKLKHDKLIEEKRHREKHLKDLKGTVEALWDRLGVQEPDRRAFMAANRGCGMRTINEFEEELSRLNELKRQNLGLFVEDARVRLQELWDGLFFSEEEMLDFTPAFSDVYSDALLSAHEAEIERLQILQEQRAPILAVIEKHRSLINDRESLAASANDASRLMARGPKGERRDPTRLLREEKMRKRIAKELPKVTSDLQKTLETYEDEYGRPFLVRGERYLDEILAAAEVRAPPRSKTPNALSKPSVPPRSKTPNPTPVGSVRGKPPTSSAARARIPMTASPSKIPSRNPLGNLRNGGNNSSHSNNMSNSPERGKMGPPRLPPPKMRAIESPAFQYRPGSVQSSYTASTSGSTGMSYTASTASGSTGIVRPISPEDVYDDRERMSYMSASMFRPMGMRAMPPPPPSRQISNTSSNLTAGSASENWETYSDASLN